MIKWLKYIWNESGKASFLIRFLIPIFGTLFALRLFGLVYVNNLDPSDFQKTTGRVTNIWIEAETPFGRTPRTEHNLKIKLANCNTEFRIYDRFEHRFDEYFEKIPIGTTVTIHHLTDKESTLSLLKSADLYQLDSNGQTLFEFQWMKYKRTGDMNSFAFLTIACWTAFGIYIYQERTKKKKADNSC
ncbi:hypothetical protein [Marinoscillum furvescens]|uniref:Uncharacterized protein n=1 Tax=Marinoscillum furvescens DSM 4134 TaxID=1122208 RepID=A0A3D9KWN0_MARFU|nr:hypothetical protein [Marinoscillum furvescens]RED91402.1 hypothetical protein C7460_1444 [Marinoscillum furvescens DSM 4134]